MESTNLRRYLWPVVSLVALTLIVLVGLSGTIMSQVEQPKYSVVKSDGKIEVRQYPPMIVAEVEVKGERMKALNEGFRLIADYIFGNNLSSKKVAMTAPVTQEPGDKIAMTAPVTQDGSGDSWKVRFVMPVQYTLDTLPKPKNDAVHLISIPARKVVAIRFSGSNTDKNINSHRAQLVEYIQEHKLAVISPSTTAFYNPPWTLPFLRRNEVVFELQ